MNEDLDPGLMARFSTARAKPLDEQFLAACLVRLEAERRRSARRLIALCGAGAALFAWRMPGLLAFTARLADQVVSMLAVPGVQAASAQPGISVAGWCGSLLLGALVLWRTPSLRRRR